VPSRLTCIVPPASISQFEASLSTQWKEPSSHKNIRTGVLEPEAAQGEKMDDFEYPTRSFRFLNDVNKEGASQSTTSPIRASVKLNIIIAGAGLGGLATAIALARSGHSVRVFEQAPALAEVSLLSSDYLRTY